MKRLTGANLFCLPGDLTSQVFAAIAILLNPERFQHKLLIFVFVFLGSLPRGCHPRDVIIHVFPMMTSRHSSSDGLSPIRPVSAIFLFVL